jgi:hypothetical protein
MSERTLPEDAARALGFVGLTVGPVAVAVPDPGDAAQPAR